MLFLLSIRGKYTMLERDYSDSAHPQAPSGAEAKARVCTLPLQLQLLLNTICSIAMMKAAMSEIGKCMPSFLPFAGPLLH
jgi:hypothetical protein